MVEWRTEHDQEFREYFPMPDEKPGIIQVEQPIDFLWWGIAILAGCAIWAGLAVFVWHGNVAPPKEEVSIYVEFDIPPTVCMPDRKCL